MDLLILFSSQPGNVISKTEIAETLWGKVHVNEDVLTRSIFKLRKALGDDARQPDYIETVSKRGYRLIADISYVSPKSSRDSSRPKQLLILAGIISAILFAAVFISRGYKSELPIVEAEGGDLIARADGFYSQFTRSNNEASLRIYERVLADEPENAFAMAGLSNALAQRVIRYEGPDSDGEAGRTSLTQALENGWLNTPEAKARLKRSLELATAATELEPSHTRAWRALGLTHSALQDFPSAERAYERALVIDPEDWGTMINLSELSVLTGQPEYSTPYLEQAWFAMERNFAVDPVAIRPWHSAIGIAVGQRRFEELAFDESKLWFQRVLSRDPLNVEAVRGLANVLTKLGDTAQADALCADLAASSDQTC